MTSDRRPRVSREHGFTLIELLVVIIIIGVLAAIAVPLYLNQRKRGIDAGLRSDLKNAATAIEAATATAGASTTPLTLADLTSGGFQPTTGNTLTVAGSTAAGYRVCGWNPASTAANASNAIMVYNSLAGGLQPGVSAAC